MILVTRLNGPVFALNPDLIERAESTPDTVLTLVDGTKYVIAESLAVLVALVRDFRASVVATAQVLEVTAATAPVVSLAVATAHPAHETPARGAGAAVLPLPVREG